MAETYTIQAERMKLSWTGNNAQSPSAVTTIPIVLNITGPCVKRTTPRTDPRWCAVRVYWIFVCQ